MKSYSPIMFDAGAQAPDMENDGVGGGAGGDGGDDGDGGTAYAIVRSLSVHSPLQDTLHVCSPEGGLDDTDESMRAM